MDEGPAGSPSRGGGGGLSRRDVTPPPLPRPVLARGFAWYLDRLMGRHFISVRWASVEAPAAWAGEPLLVVANHTNWWDGFLAHQLTRALGRRFQVLMDAKGLATYPFFRHFGAAPVHRDSPMGAMADLAAVRANIRPDVALWLFPQGRRSPAGMGITTLETGAAHLALTAPEPVRVVPVAFRYPFLSEQLPEALALVGATQVVTPSERAGREERRALTADLSVRLAATVARLDVLLAEERVDGFRVLVQGRMSFNKRMDRVRHATGLLDGPFEERNG